MLSIQDLPAVNAGLNATSAVFLTFGYSFIRRKRVAAHRFCMLAAFAASILFFTSYLIYHAHVGSRHFAGQGWVRPVYFTILISHTLLAVLVPVLAVITLYRALKGRFDRHAPIARWTLPIWLYVSATGVVIYWMLYWLFPAG